MLNFLLTSRKVGVSSKPPRKSRIGIVSPARESGISEASELRSEEADLARERRP